MNLLDKVSKFVQYLKNSENFSDNSIASYKRDVVELIDISGIGLIKFEEIDIEFIENAYQKYIEVLQSKNVADSSISRKCSALNKFLNYLDFPIKIYPSKSLKKRIKDPNSSLLKNEYLNDSQFQIIREKVFEGIKPLDVRDQVIFSLLAEEGISVRRAIAINLEDVNIKEGKIYLPNESNNVFEITPKSIDILREYISSARFDITQIKEENALLVSQFGTRITRQSIWLICSNWQEKFQLSYSVSPRILIGTAIRRLLLKNIEDNEVSIRLGHTNIMSTKAFIRKINKAGNLR